MLDVPPPQLVNLETTAGFVGHIESLAVSFGCQKYVILHGCVDRLCILCIQRHRCGAVVQLAGAGILEPVFGRLDRIHGYVAGTVRPIRKCGMPADRTAARQIAVHQNIAVAPVVALSRHNDGGIAHVLLIFDKQCGYIAGVIICGDGFG
jgi:hypothetical protein